MSTEDICFFILNFAPLQLPQWSIARILTYVVFPYNPDIKPYIKAVMVVRRFLAYQFTSDYIDGIEFNAETYKFNKQQLYLRLGQELIDPMNLKEVEKEVAKEIRYRCESM